MKKKFIFLMILLFLIKETKEEEDYDSLICNKKGIYEKSECYCLKSYESINGKFCNYEKKRKIIAIILSLFFGFSGVDQYYLGKNIRGFLKCFFPVFLFLSLLFYIYKNSDKPLNKPNDIFFLIRIFFLLFFWFIDFFFIIIGFTKDSKGFDLI